MSSLYDFDLISKTIPIILDNSKMWYRVLSTSMKLQKSGLAHVEGVNRADLKYNSQYSNVLLINRTASLLSCSPDHDNHPGLWSVKTEPTIVQSCYHIHFFQRMQPLS